MKKIFLISFVFTLASCQSPSTHLSERDIASSKFGSKFGKKAVRNYFLSLTLDERNEILSRAEIFDQNYDPQKISQVDVLTEIQKNCPAPFSYQKAVVEVQDRLASSDNFNQSHTVDSYKWGQIQCEYHPDVDKSMGGGSTKYLCDITDAESKDGKSTKKLCG